MVGDHVETFTSSLQDLADTVHRVGPADFPDTLETVIEEPAIGVPLPSDDISLTDTSVSTDFDATDLEAARSGVTPVGMGVADYGTVTVRSAHAGDELVSLFADRHVAVVRAGDIVLDMDAGFERLSSEFDRGLTSQVLATGPSATADLGGFILGVHGPEAVEVVVVDP